MWKYQQKKFLYIFASVIFNSNTYKSYKYCDVLKKKKKVFISKVHNKISLKFSNHAYNLQNYFVKIILLTVLKKFNLLLKIKLTFHLLRRFICVNLKSVFNFIL